MYEVQSLMYDCVTHEITDTCPHCGEVPVFSGEQGVCRCNDRARFDRAIEEAKVVNKIDSPFEGWD